MVKLVSKAKSAPVSKAKALKRSSSKASTKRQSKAASIATSPTKKGSKLGFKNSYMKSIPMFKSMPDYFQMNKKYAKR